MPKAKERVPFVEEYERAKRESAWAEREAEAKRRNRRVVGAEKRLFWFLMLKFNLTTDQELAEFLGTAPSQISQIRTGKIGLSPRLLLVIYDKTNLSVEDIREMANEDVTEEDK